MSQAIVFVRASDIHVDGDIEIINPDLVIANLSGPDAKLEMELTIGNGRGYVGSDKNKKPMRQLMLLQLTQYTHRLRE